MTSKASHGAIKAQHTAANAHSKTVFSETVRMPTNDPSSASRPTGGVDGNSDAMAGFAAAHG
jgi:hypothetical protein